MRVSIVTLSFDQAAFLERAMRSVLDQDHPDIEYIVVDPGSTDGSRDLIGRFRDRLALAIEEPDDGPADGLNKGFARATGEIFAYLNADDAFLPGAVSGAVRALASHPTAAVVYAHGYIVDERGRVRRRFRSNRFSRWRFAFGGVNVMQQATFFRRAAFQAVGGFNVANRTCWDAELLVDIACRGGALRACDAMWAVFTVHPESISGSGRLNETYAADIRRLAAKALGRDLPATTPCWRALARALKWAGDPVGVWWKLRDRLLGPPQWNIR